MTSEAILVQGTSVKISSAPVAELAPSPQPVFATLDCIMREMQYQSGAATENDATTICSTAKDFRLGISDSGTLSVSGHWRQGHPAHAVIRSASVDKQTRLIVVEFEDGSNFSALALVSQRSWAAAVDGVVTANYRFRLTGQTLEQVPTELQAAVIALLQQIYGAQTDEFLDRLALFTTSDSLVLNF